VAPKPQYRVVNVRLLLSGGRKIGKVRSFCSYIATRQFYTVLIFENASYLLAKRWELACFLHALADYES
jgi:hypothetical protein